METVDAGRSGIDGQELIDGVELHLEDVRMAGNEELRAQLLDALCYARGVVARIAADVCHQHLHPLASERGKLGVDAPRNASIDVAIDGA